MKLTVASYNIMHAGMVDYDMERLVTSIRACRADIVGIQEVDECTRRCGGRDLTHMLGEALGYEAVFIPAIDYAGGRYGTAILSRYPIEQVKYFPLESGKHEKRSIGTARIRVDDVTVSFWNTHVSFESREQRRIQLEQIRGLLPTGEPWILTGDFNTGDFEELRTLGDASLVNDHGHTFGTFRESGSPIDNIIYTAPWRLCRAGMIDNANSDHNLLYAELIR